MDQPRCAFCKIAAGSDPASVIFRDDLVIAFMTTRPTRPGECIIMPIVHVNHFIELDDRTAQRIVTTGQLIGRRIQAVFQPQGVGMVIHGFAPHAHLLIVPQHEHHDITSARFAKVVDGTVNFECSTIAADRAGLDKYAELLRID
jgi:histidine triad (HIT) family protein